MRKIDAKYAVQVVPDTKRAAVDMDRWRAEQEARPVKIRTEVDRSSLDKIKKDFGKVASDLGSALKTNLSFAAVGELPALATALNSVTGALVQLSGAGFAVPGIFAGIAASAGTAALGVHGMGDALKALDKASDGSAKSIKAANDALAKLSPNAADVVRTISGLKPAFQDLTNLDSQNLFAGISQSIHSLVDADLPHLRTGVAAIATSLNQNLKQLGTSLSSGSSQGLLDRILGNTGNAQARLSKAIDPIVHAFGTLAAVGSDTLPRLADGVGKLADRFDHFILAADDSGKLSKWISDGITGFDQLGDTVINIGKVFTALTQAAGGSGGLLAVLDRGSEKLANFLNSVKGQDDLKRFFQEGRDELNQLVPILENLGPIANSAFQAAKDATAIWLPVIKDVTDVLAKDPDLVRGIADAFLAWKFVSVITDVTTAVKGVATALGLIGPAAAEAGTVGAAGLAPLLAALGPITALAAAVAAVTGGHPQTYVGFGADSPGKAAQDGNWGKALFGDAWPGGSAPPKSGPLPPPSTAGLQTLPGFTGAPAPAGSSPTGASTDDIRNNKRNPTLDQLFPGVTGVAGPHALGGILPGYSPGRDNMLVPMSGGEGVIVPPVARALGTAGVAAINRGALTRGYADGGIVDSFLGGIGGPIGNISGLLGGKKSGDSTGTGLTPGLAGLFEAGSDPGKLGQWGQQTGDWLGNFASKTLLSFGTTLWQGALGLVGLQDSILSPSNPWFQDAAKGAGFFLGNDGPLGAKGSGTTKAAGPSGKQIREGQEKIGRADQRVAEVQQRMSELKPDAKQSEKLALQNELTNAQQDAGDARTDFAALGSGGTQSSSLDAFAASQAGKPYISGGQSQAGTDCSGWASEVVKQYLGESPFSGDRMTTQNAAQWITAHGGQLGVGPPGSLQIGWYNHGSNPDDGHMAVTLPDGTNTESGGSGNRIAFGGSATGAGSGQFDQHAYFPPRTGFAKGGILPGYSPGVDNMLVHMSGGEGVIVPHIAKKLGPQGIDAINRGVLTRGFAPGGIIPDELIPPHPLPQVPDAHRIIPPARQIVPRASATIPSAPTTPLPAAVIPAPPTAVAPAQPFQATGPTPAGGAPDSSATHLLPAVSTAITSGAAAAGNAAAAAASMGLGGLGGGAAGGLISGGIQQLGKIAVNAANVGASLLVGSVPGSFGDPNLPAYGQTQMPGQNVPKTAADAHALGGGNTTYNITGMGPREIMDELRLRDAQDQQAQLASVRG